MLQKTPAQEPGVEPGSLQTIDAEGNPGVVCPLKGTQVSAKIEGFGARVVVLQTFTNPSTKPIEAVYTFPLPDDSAVDGMRMIIGDRIIEGVIQKRATAQQIYDEAKKQGKSAALLNQERPNVFTQSVANIPAGAEIKVAITYVQILKFENDEFEFVYPMVVGPRYTGATTPDPSKVTPAVVPQGTRSGSTIKMNIEIEAGAPITSLESELHKISVQRPDDKTAKVELAQANEIPNRDFILRYGISSGDMVGSFLTYTDAKKGGFFTLIVMPPKQVSPDKVAPKEALFVMDQSGSQEGQPIEKSKELTVKLVEALNPHDTFNVVSFSSDYKILWPKAQPNTPARRKEAIDYIRSLTADGGTELERALSAALQMPPDPTRPRIVVFNTDGYIGGETVALQLIQKHRGNARIFTFGIGDSVNRYLIDAMSIEGRGDSEVVTLESNVDECVDRLVQRTDAPVLTDVSVQFDGVKVRDTLPRYIPDVFSEEPVIIKGRYDKPGDGFVTVKGKMAGLPWSRKYPIHFPSEGNSGSAIGSLWAREKVTDLEHQQRMMTNWGETPVKGQENPEYWENTITDLALDFGIMTQYTSFVAVDRKVVNPGGEQDTISVPVDMPEGVSYEKIFGGAMASKSGATLAPAPVTTAFRSGDPLLTVDAPRNAKSVIAVFPGGDLKPLAWNTKTEKWEVRFDIPATFKEGTYKVEVFVLDQNGLRKRIVVPFDVSMTAPELKPSAEMVSGAWRVAIDGDPRWARVILLTPWGDRLPFEYDAATGRIRLDLKLPDDFKGGWFRLVGLDRAHNQAEVRFLVNAKGEIEKVEPIDSK
jgi:Ca-activated chloride channel family protein